MHVAFQSVSHKCMSQFLYIYIHINKLYIYIHIILMVDVNKCL